ncbi:TPA: acetyltransferase [Staphylococcus aureus]|uniref:acetyltransferase n=1 Tax=Staphylococcus aureus TaxID=1280 RepID=UPI0020BF4A14|nr:acetyltransferase [Staphylococcus aureus]MDQ7899401.1 acetyltransferase [Staphylococcus aureus]HBU9596352.1 acetyltransferase [Staphylococcus aureus]HBV0468734.1 acetyltransferase [Staphylococcus aureus]HCV8509226.1 acetyltransferase [Staphylococcus aureus]HCW7774883.1 acetyltransferase [Staphylococcus aureus]
MTVTLSDEQYKNLCTKLNKLLGKFHKALKERDEYKKQQDELIVDIGKLRERNKELENMWRTLKNELLGRYEHYCFKIRELHPESKANRIGALYIGGKSTADIILSRMEELDGTNEFYEFLGQMEDDTNE